MFKLSLVFFLVLICAAGCAGKKAKKNQEIQSNKPYEIFEDALKAIDNYNYEQAIRLFQILEQQFPFEKFSAHAQLELIYSYFESRNFIAANAAIERFKRLRNGHKHMDYVYYMQGLVSYSEDSPLRGGSFAVDVTKRDLGSAKDSIAYFTEFLDLYPESRYAGDAQLRIQYLRNLKARQEINVANFYLKREAYISAISRAKYVIENFQQSPAVPDGFAILYMCYKILEFKEFSSTILEILQENYPKHPILAKVGAPNERSWLLKLALQKNSLLNTVTLGILDSPSAAVDTRVIYNTQYQKPNKEPKLNE